MKHINLDRNFLLTISKTRGCLNPIYAIIMTSSEKDLIKDLLEASKVIGVQWVFRSPRTGLVLSDYVTVYLKLLFTYSFKCLLFVMVWRSLYFVTEFNQCWSLFVINQWRQEWVNVLSLVLDKEIRVNQLGSKIV